MKKRLVFGEGLMIPSIKGKKRITLRKYREDAHDFSNNEEVIGEFKDGLDIPLRITADTVKKPFSELTDEEAREDDFLDAEDAFNGLQEYYHDLKKEDLLAVIRYDIDTSEAEENLMVVVVNKHSK
jgi:hypothetical protein